MKSPKKVIAFLLLVLVSSAFAEIAVKDGEKIAFLGDSITLLGSRFESGYVNLVIDEFGREPNPASNYGTKMNVLQFVLQLRYDHRRTSVTHITTNMSIEDIEPNYGDYVADRCKEMFNFIEFSGRSLR